MKKSLISAIKKLLAKLGAEEIEGNNLVEVIDNGADMIEGGVADGIFFDIVVTADGNDRYTANKTFAEITSALQSNKQVRVKYNDGIYYCTGVISDALNFSRAIFNNDSTKLQVEVFVLDENGVRRLDKGPVSPIK